MCTHLSTLCKSTAISSILHFSTRTMLEGVHMLALLPCAESTVTTSGWICVRQGDTHSAINPPHQKFILYRFSLICQLYCCSITFTTRAARLGRPTLNIEEEEKAMIRKTRRLVFNMDAILNLNIPLPLMQQVGGNDVQ